MPALLGVNANIGIALSQIADTYGVAEAVTEKLVVESITWNENVTKLQSAGIGSGGKFTDNLARGTTAGTVTITGLCGYNNGFPLLLAQFLGTAGAPTEQNNPEGDWLHEITFNSSVNRTFLTVAIESSSTTVIEFPSVTVNSLTVTGTPGDYLRYTAECNFDELVDTSPTNNNAAIQALTQTDTELAVCAFEETFQINAQGGVALSGSDNLAITSFELNMAQPQSFKPEIKGSAGNSVPTSDDKATGTLTVQLKEHDDNTYETAAQAATEYKSALNVQGTQIGSGDNKTIELLCPRLILLDTPDFGLANPGNNPQTLVFDIADASANPTGMTDTTPYANITNEQTTAYIS